VYIVWGSTYLAIRITVSEGGGFPPFTMGLWRISLAAVILLGWVALRGQWVMPTRRELWVLAVSGLLLWTVANGLVVWGEQRADSGLASLLVGSMPIWVALMEALVDRKLPSAALFGSLVVGFIGIGVLSFPVLRDGVQADFLSWLALLGAPIAWGAGSLLQSRNPTQLSPRASSGIQMVAGALGFLVLSRALGEPMPTPSFNAWLAFGYLVVFGSLLAFTSYVTALQILPTNVIMTYSYVNPVIAVLLGWLILGEEITGWTIGGTGLVLLGVFGVFRERYQARAARAAPTAAD
jgi:drug/metabolite transporter (DMT)-like permease